MKFVDEAIVKVRAGNGGRGAIGFRREKFVPFGGPDGGDGGEGGSVWLRAQQGINTLVDYRVQRTFRAQNGQPGGGQDCTGRGGEDLYVPMPVGTVVLDDDTGETLGDLTKAGQTLLVAKGGKGGWGNQRFKSSTNRTPRQSGPGLPGEARSLRVELRLLADVGLLGLPNAGKSTLIRAVSAARPKVADYPFTTLHPQLGVVSVGPLKSFVMADIPGLIEGAAEGAGLGIRFLKHLQRTRLLLHLVDIAPLGPGRGSGRRRARDREGTQEIQPGAREEERAGWCSTRSIWSSPPSARSAAPTSCGGCASRDRCFRSPARRARARKRCARRSCGNLRSKRGLPPCYLADSALIWAARRLLCRAALLRWMMPLRAIESMTGEAAFSAAAASAFLPALIASTTLRTALRTFERCATFRARLYDRLAGPFFG